MRRLRLWRFSRRGVDVDASAYVARSAILWAGGGHIEIGAGCEINEFCMLLARGGSIRMGRNCSVHPFCVLYGHGGLVIGDHVRIATHTIVIPANHRFDDTSRNIAEQGETRLGITIEDDVWIGAGVSVLDGVTIGSGVVVGSGAVVTSDVPRNMVVAGVPARCIRMRGDREPGT